MLSIIAKQIFNEIQGQISSNKDSIEGLSSRIQPEIEGILRKAGLVSRQEFKAQTDALDRATKKLALLEEQLLAIEKEITK